MGLSVDLSWVALDPTQAIDRSLSSLGLHSMNSFNTKFLVIDTAFKFLWLSSLKLEL